MQEAERQGQGDKAGISCASYPSPGWLACVFFLYYWVGPRGRGGLVICAAREVAC